MTGRRGGQVYGRRGEDSPLFLLRWLYFLKKERALALILILEKGGTLSGVT